MSVHVGNEIIQNASVCSVVQMFHFHFPFQELDPPFCIQNVGAELERLPTASTCMNLLKLPDFKEPKMLKTKLLYAVESEAGFELS